MSDNKAEQDFTLGRPVLVCRWRLASGGLPMENRHLRALSKRVVNGQAVSTQLVAWAKQHIEWTLRDGSALNPDGVLVLDEQLVPEPPDFSNVIRIPITKYAIEKLGKPLFANIIALGALVKVTGLVDIDDVKTCVSRRVPPHTVEKNMQALDIGYGSVK